MDVLAIDSTGNNTSVASKIGDDLLSISVNHERNSRPDWQSLLQNISIDSRDLSSFDLFVLPGGPGVFELRKNPFVLKVIQKHFNHGKWIGAICAAPLLLLDAKVLNGTKYTAHASVVNELPNLLPEEDVVVDKNIITSAGAGTAVRFGLKLVELLLSEEKANEIAHSIHAPYPIDKK